MRMLLFLLMFISGSVSAQSYYLFVGTYTNSGSKGIYVYRFNSATGKSEAVSSTEDVVNPSYLAISADKKFLYAVNETGGAKPGSVSAFSFDQTTGKLSFINKQLSGGDAPCYITVSKNNKWAVVANYSGGSLAALPIDAHGALQPYSQLIQHTGTGVNAKRQEKPHVHSTVFSPNQDYIFSPDLGLDKVFAYEFHPEASKPLQDAQPPFTEVTPGGGGPRHFTFHPNQQFAYLIEEMSGNVIAYKYNKGKLTLVQSIAAHPADFKGGIGSADIHISPDGNYLYASNRGDENSLAIFSIDSKTGKIVSKGFQSTLGKTPRNFVIDPSGNYLLVANQDTDNIVIFKRNRQTGLLQDTGEQIKVPKPVCLQIMK
ncbi:MAG: lactonase family protein [Chitinophagaceae bacterium]